MTVTVHGWMKPGPVFSGRSSETRSNYGKANPPVHYQDTAAPLRYSHSRNFANYEIAPRYCSVPQVSLSRNFAYYEIAPR